MPISYWNWWFSIATLVDRWVFLLDFWGHQILKFCGWKQLWTSTLEIMHSRVFSLEISFKIKTSTLHKRDDRWWDLILIDSVFSFQMGWDNPLIDILVQVSWLFIIISDLFGYDWPCHNVWDTFPRCSIWQSTDVLLQAFVNTPLGGGRHPEVPFLLAASSQFMCLVILLRLKLSVFHTPSTPP